MPYNNYFTSSMNPKDHAGCSNADDGLLVSQKNMHISDNFCKKNIRGSKKKQPLDFINKLI